MSFEDWQKNFQKLEICNLGPDSLSEEEANQGKKRWEATAEQGEWIPRVNAGGCRNYLGMSLVSNKMSRIVRKPAFCICENKDTDQLRSNCEADQRLCFRYSDSTIPLLPKSEISSL